MFFYYHLLLALQLYAFPGGAAVLPSQEVKVGEVFTLYESQQVVLTDSLTGAALYTLYLQQLVDSRCPKDATCIWAGEVTLLVQVAEQSSSAVPATVKLAKAAQLYSEHKTKPSAVSFGTHYSLLLLDAQPYPTTTIHLQASEVHLQVVRVP